MSKHMQDFATKISYSDYYYFNSKYSSQQDHTLICHEITQFKNLNDNFKFQTDDKDTDFG